MTSLEEAYGAVVQGTSFTCFTSTKVQALTAEEVEAFSAACLSAGLAAWHQVSLLLPTLPLMPLFSLS